MKNALAISLLVCAVFGATAVPASAQGGYLHRSDALAAAARYASSVSGSVGTCVRHANRVFGCWIHYERVPLGGDLWNWNEAAAVVLQHGTLAVHSRVFTDLQ